MAAIVQVLAIAFCLAGLYPLAAAPLIFPGGVKNAASFESATPPPNAHFPSAGIAPGSIFTIRGRELSPAEPVAGSLPYPNRLPDAPGGTEVIVRSLETATDFPAWLLYTAETQINAILPSTVPVGAAEVVVIYNGESNDAVPIRVLFSAPGLFALSQNGYGSGVIQNYESPHRQSLNQLTRPARPGSYIILWGTGLGAISSPDNVPPPVGTVDPDLTVRIAGVDLQPDYAGRAPGYPGLDQINVRLPDDGSIPDGCYREVQLHTGNFFSRTVQLSVSASGDPCTHPLGLSTDQLARLDAGEMLSAAYFWFSNARFQSPAALSLHASISRRYPWMFVTSDHRWVDTPAFFTTTSCGSGSGTGGLIGRVLTTPPDGATMPEPPHLGIDAGDRLHLDGPGGRSLALRKSEHFEWFGGYESETPDLTLPDDFNAGGPWTLHSTGGADVAAFSSTFTLPPPVRGDAPPLIDRTQDLTLSWDPIDNAPAGFMEVQVLAFEPPGDDPLLRNFKLVSCHAPPAAGSVTIPATLLNELPPTADALIVFDLRPVRPYTTRFTIPGIDYAEFHQSTADSHATEIR